MANTFKNVLRLWSGSSDPSSGQQDGDLHYNSTDQRVKARVNGATVSVAHTSDLPLAVSGRYYSQNQLQSAIASTFQLISGTPYYIPVFCSAPTPIDRIGMNVTSAGAGGTCWMGLYSHSAATAGRAGSKVTTFGNLAVASNGAKELTVAAVIPAGWSWIGLLPLVQNTTFSGLSVAQQRYFPVSQSGISLTAGLAYDTDTNTAAATLPITASLSGTGVTNAVQPAVFWRTV